MGENVINNFALNLKEIKELSDKLKKPLEEPITVLYHNEEKRIIKYKGGYIDNKYEGRGILYDCKGNIEYDGYFLNNEYDGFGNLFFNKILDYEGYFS